jgi:hypothetical protein
VSATIRSRESLSRRLFVRRRRGISRPRWRSGGPKDAAAVAGRAPECRPGRARGSTWRRRYGRPARPPPPGSLQLAEAVGQIGAVTGDGPACLAATVERLAQQRQLRHVVLVELVDTHDMAPEGALRLRQVLRGTKSRRVAITHPVWVAPATAFSIEPGRTVCAVSREAVRVDATRGLRPWRSRKLPRLGMRNVGDFAATFGRAPVSGCGPILAQTSRPTVCAAVWNNGARAPATRVVERGAWSSVVGRRFRRRGLSRRRSPVRVPSLAYRIAGPFRRVRS